MRWPSTTSRCWRRLRWMPPLGPGSTPTAARPCRSPRPAPTDRSGSASCPTARRHPDPQAPTARLPRPRVSAGRVNVHRLSGTRKVVMDQTLFGVDHPPWGDGGLASCDGARPNTAARHRSEAPGTRRRRDCIASPPLHGPEHLDRAVGNAHQEPCRVYLWSVTYRCCTPSIEPRRCPRDQMRGGTFSNDGVSSHYRVGERHMRQPTDPCRAAWDRKPWRY
jgi:hypothetical protein